MDFRDNNEYCGLDRVLRLMQKEGICAQRDSQPLLQMRLQET
ncbi:hypothetical protein AEST_12770 [Alishewanella aestuarii B11]|uniref:Uncharacterized protein n=2 Tax=Alishewanella aestuarii TaxID=453835 RepID=J1YDB9_9ALTE|nr:hypothetical protein AEST_12770 [Alishewanella aestuarii B11]